MTGPAVPLVWVDAFSEVPFRGNPAAVCLLEGPVGEAAMQSLAFELGLSETAFVWPEGAHFGLRWFTPAAEVDLCGHATIAAAHALRGAGRLGIGRARFSTKSGWLEATFDGDEIEIDLPGEVPSPVDVPAVLAAHLPAVGAATGRFDLLVELESEEAVRRVDPVTLDLLSLPYRGIAVTAKGEAPLGATADYVLRFFAPRVGVPEDPVTGSAQCLLGPYWAGALGRSTLRAVQLSARGGALRVRVGDGRVGVAGRSSTVLTGTVTGEAARRLVAASDAGDVLRALVSAHPERDPRERAAKARFLEELGRLGRPFDRDADPVHVTASAVVVGSRGTVLHRHRRLGRWLQPGGHVDPGEPPQRAALRETQEETGLDVAHPPGGPTLVHLDVHAGADDHVHLDLRYLLLAPDRDPEPAPGESPDAKWFSWDEAEAVADDALVGALRAARALVEAGTAAVTAGASTTTKAVAGDAG